MSDGDHERAMSEYMRWADVQLAARDCFREGVSADAIRSLIAPHSEDARREISELEQMFELGEDEQS